MTDNQAIQIARLYGTPIQEKNAEVEYRFTLEQLKMLISTTITVEREACAKLCDEQARVALSLWHKDIKENKSFWDGERRASDRCAEAIRARGET